LPAPDNDRKEEGPRLSPVTMLPPSVWREHIRPLLNLVEVVHLRAVCKALKASVEEWPMRLGERDRSLTYVAPEVLEAALTCLPATESVKISFKDNITSAEASRLVDFLRARGGTLKRFVADNVCSQKLLSCAMEAAALPNLTYFCFELSQSIDRRILSDGMLEHLEEVGVTVGWIYQKDWIAALEHLRRLRHLRRLSLDWDEDKMAALPPFIPPSLKSPTLFFKPLAALEGLLLGLPCMLQASGASLEVIVVRGPRYGGGHVQGDADCGAALAQVLRGCSSTLKVFEVLDEGIVGNTGIRELSSGIASCCATLEVLRIPSSVFSALPATCPSFSCLRELELIGRFAGDFFASPVWDVMANGRLPALATLSIPDAQEFCPPGLDKGEGGGNERRLVQAFQAVAGTLRKLSIRGSYGGDPCDEASYELGVAIGKLRCLSSLLLQDLHRDGRAYHALARGVAASGGCPQLFDVYWSGVERNLHWLTAEPSLFVRSVRKVFIGGADCTEEEALLLCGGLVQTGYKHYVWLGFRGPGNDAHTDSVLDCMWAILSGGGIENADV
jgi:hypothetical protein